MATYEEKGIDVNVAAHLLVDVLANGFDAAVVLSNYSDLRRPVQKARGPTLRTVTEDPPDGREIARRDGCYS